MDELLQRIAEAIQLLRQVELEPGINQSLINQAIAKLEEK